MPSAISRPPEFVLPDEETLGGGPTGCTLPPDIRPAPRAVSARFGSTASWGAGATCALDRIFTIPVRPSIERVTAGGGSTTAVTGPARPRLECSATSGGGAIISDFMAERTTRSRANWTSGAGGTTSVSSAAVWDKLARVASNGTDGTTLPMATILGIGTSWSSLIAGGTTTD